MVDQQDRFFQEILELSRNNTSQHNVLHTKDKIQELISKVQKAKSVSIKNDQDRHLLKKYDVVQVSGLEKLIRRQQDGELLTSKMCFQIILFIQIMLEYYLIL